MVEIHPDKFVDTQLKLSDIAEELEYIQLDTARIVNPRWQIKMTEPFIVAALSTWRGHMPQVITATASASVTKGDSIFGDGLVILAH